MIISRQEFADMLRSAERAGRPIEPLTSLAPEMSVDDAYAIQSINLARRSSPLVGRKIGLTSRAVQRQLGVDQPDFGGLVAAMEIAPGEPVRRSELIAPRIEAEIAFVLDRDLDAVHTSATDVLRATAFLLPALEIIDSRIADWRIGFLDTVADNASSARYALGLNPAPVVGSDLVAAGCVMRKNGLVASTGTGAACFGHPAAAVAWLANTLARRGEPLGAGDLVLSGALGPITPVEAGDVVEAEIARVGRVSVRFV